MLGIRLRTEDKEKKNTYPCLQGAHGLQEETDLYMNVNLQYDLYYILLNMFSELLNQGPMK